MNGYFYGWYFKNQSDRQTLAVIPAVHGAGRARTCSIQFITADNTWTISYPFQLFHKKEDCLFIGENRFGRNGLHLQIDTPQLKAEGNLRFSNLSPLKYDIMGPFVFVPFMECRHSVYSMYHNVDGCITINDKEYCFKNAIGYWEGDRGRSFPKNYAWTQCLFQDHSLMLSVADIPLAGIHFTGIIGVVRWKGKEYRFATYLGARIVQKSNHRLLVRQGRLEFEARLLEKNAHPLQAPESGAMTRTIRENVRCKAFYRLRKNGQTVFAFETEQASFEYEY